MIAHRIISSTFFSHIAQHTALANYQTIMPKRRHPDDEGPGRHRQRELDEQPDQQHEEFVHSKIASFLMVSFFHGEISLPFLTTLAQLMLVEPVNHIDIQKLAALGTHGANPGHSFRDLLTRMVTFSMERAISTIRLPVKLLGKSTWIDFSLLAPHLLFSLLYHSNPSEFGRRFFGGRLGNLKDFWRSQTSHPSYINHPMHTEPGLCFETHGTPLFMHGDDVAVIGVSKIWSKAVCVLSFGGLLSLGQISDDKHFLMALLFNCILNSTEEANTYKVLWHYLTWSFYWLQRGIHPTHDPQGNKYLVGRAADLAGTWLANGFHGILWSGQFDLDFAQSRFHLADPLSGIPCMCCDATNSGPGCWTDCTDPPANGWAAKTYTNESFAAKHGDSRHRLFRVLGGFGVANFVADLLHCKWLGADQYFHGGVLWLLIRYVMPDDIETNLGKVVVEIKKAYLTVGVLKKDQYPNLKRTQIKGGHAAKLPKLKGTGQQCKGLSKVMGLVFRIFGDRDDPMHICIAECLDAIRDTDRIYESSRNEYRTPPADSKRLIELTFSIGRKISILIDYYHPRLIPCFHFTIKQHYTMHCALASAYTNPVHNECSSGENFMKFTKILLRGCMYGNPPARITNMAILKYVKGFEIKNKETAKWWK